MPYNNLSVPKQSRIKESSPWRPLVIECILRMRRKYRNSFPVDAKYVDSLADRICKIIHRNHHNIHLFEISPAKWQHMSGLVSKATNSVLQDTKHTLAYQMYNFAESLGQEITGALSAQYIKVNPEPPRRPNIRRLIAIIASVFAYFVILSLI